MNSKEKIELPSYAQFFGEVAGEFAVVGAFFLTTYFVLSNNLVNFRENLPAFGFYSAFWLSAFVGGSYLGSWACRSISDMRNRRKETKMDATPIFRRGRY